MTPRTPGEENELRLMRVLGCLYILIAACAAAYLILT